MSVCIVRINRAAATCAQHHACRKRQRHGCIALKWTPSPPRRQRAMESFTCFPALSTAAASHMSQVSTLHRTADSQLVLQHPWYKTFWRRYVLEQTLTSPNRNSGGPFHSMPNVTKIAMLPAWLSHSIAFTSIFTYQP